MYLSESINNIIENIKNFIFMISFLVIGFTGIALTDSMIYSTSLQAESELNVNGNDVLSIDFSKTYSGERITKLFNGDVFTLSKMKEAFFHVGDSPFSEEMKLVLGVDIYKLNNIAPGNEENFKDNVVVVPYDSPFNKGDNIFLNGVPFKVIGKVKNKKTDFLDSLGISTTKFNSRYLIPVQTMYRLILDDYIKSVDLIKKEEISLADIEFVRKIFADNDITDYSVHSVLDAKKTVENVFNRFSVLTNSVYVMLTIMAVIIVTVSCRKIFQNRTIEFALKVIHGIDKRIIIRIVILEVIITVIASSLISIFITMILIYFMSQLFQIDMHIRLLMISVSFMIVIVSCYMVSIYSGNQFFNINPVSLIKKNSL
ncbi:ABC transporter permease [Salmonella enterica subsp. enterica serovar Montevideo]|nr:ABC transporter permease [Salmonella enterica subsp. enterica serovar Montevideo]